MGTVGTVRNLNWSATGRVTITGVQANGERVKTLVRDVSRRP